MNNFFKNTVLTALLIPLLLLMAGCNFQASVEAIHPGVYENYIPDPKESRLEPYEPSDTQTQYLQVWGNPSRYQIVFYDDTRQETWYWDEYGWAVNFVNGVYFTEHYYDPSQIEGLGRSAFSPLTFTAEMGLDEVLTVTGNSRFAAFPLDDPAVGNGLLVTVAGLELGFLDEELTLVEAVPIDPASQP